MNKKRAPVSLIWHTMFLCVILSKVLFGDYDELKILSAKEYKRSIKVKLINSAYEFTSTILGTSEND